MLHLVPATLLLVSAPAPVAVAFAAHPLPAWIATSTVASPQADAAAEFRKKFADAVRFKDRKEMDQVVRKYREVAIDAFLLKAETRSTKPTADLNQWVDNFIESWARVFRSDFARNYDRYMQLMDSSRRSTRSRILSKEFHSINNLHIRAAQTGDVSLWPQVQKEVELLAAGLEQTGDLYFSAFVYNIKGNSYNPVFNDESGDMQKAYEAYVKVLELRDKLDLKSDKFYSDVKGQVDELRAKLGIPDPETGEKIERKIHPEEILPLEGATWSQYSLKAEPEKKPGNIRHPSDMGDLHRHSWWVASFGKVGETRELPLLVPKVSITRLSPVKFILEAGASPSEEFRLSDKPTAVEYERKHEDGTVDMHAVFLATGLEQDNFQGATLNLSGGDDGGTLFMRTVATRTAKTDFGNLVLYDLNGDGSFGYPKNLLAGAHGLPEETWLYRYDTISLGKSKYSQPFCPWISTDKGEWFQIDMESLNFAHPDSIQMMPVQPRTGTGQVTIKGLKGLRLVSAVLKSESSYTKGLLVDLMASKKGIREVPIGRYTFQQGLVRDPKKGYEAVILPPKDVPIYVEIEEGKTATLELGAPFKLVADYDVREKKVVLNGQSLHVAGKSRERYLRMVGVTLFDTEVQLKGGKGKSFPPSLAEDINSKWALAYYPNNLEVSFGGSFKPFRLFYKKHPWFGNLESDWIEKK